VRAKCSCLAPVRGDWLGMPSLFPANLRQHRTDSLHLMFWRIRQHRTDNLHDLLFWRIRAAPIVEEKATMISQLM